VGLQVLQPRERNVLLPRAAELLTSGGWYAGPGEPVLEPLEVYLSGGPLNTQKHVAGTGC